MSARAVRRQLDENERALAELRRAEWAASDARQPRVDLMSLASLGISAIEGVRVADDGTVSVDDLLWAIASGRNR